MQTELISCLGTDLTVVNAARVSFDNESDWEVNHSVRRELSSKDTALIRYLAKHNHFTPFTHCMITIRETIPIFVARQRFKHTIGFSYNEVSRRYVDDTPEFYTPDTWRGKADNAKQGSSEKEIDINPTVQGIPPALVDVYQHALRHASGHMKISWTKVCVLNRHVWYCLSQCIRVIMLLVLCLPLHVLINYVLTNMHRKRYKN